MRVDGLIHNATIASFDDTRAAPRGAVFRGIVPRGYVAWQNALLSVVAEGEPPPDLIAKTTLDAAGKLLTPGLVDCHTHLVYAGDRAQEFAWRLKGRTYDDIARAGGGIMNTVRATRHSDVEELYSLARRRVVRLAAGGVTTLEIKSGYGLNVEDELKLLRVIARLGAELPLCIQATCLAAHTLPPDFQGSKDDYLEHICRELLPQIKRQGLASAVDIYCESIAFDAAQARRLFACAQALGFEVKGHVEQLSQSGGVDVLCDVNALSADHLEYANSAQIQAMKRRGVVAVLLPGAFYFLGQAQVPPIAEMRQAGVAMAVATDANPGTSPLFSLTAAANLACTQFGLTPEEALRGITVNGARALGLDGKKGALKSGADADLVLWNTSSPQSLVYELPAPPLDSVWIAGEIVNPGCLT